MIFNLQNWIFPDIIGLMGGGSQRGTSVYNVIQISMEIRMDAKDKTLWEDWITIIIGGQCDG